MAVTARHTSAQGAQIEYGTVSVDPGSIGAGAVLAVSVTITGADTTDQIFVMAGSSLHDDLFVHGATVTGADTVTLDIGNESGGSIDDGATTFAYMLVKAA